MPEPKFLHGKRYRYLVLMIDTRILRADVARQQLVDYLGVSASELRVCRVGVDSGLPVRANPALLRER